VILSNWTSSKEKATSILPGLFLITTEFNSTFPMQIVANAACLVPGQGIGYRLRFGEVFTTPEVLVWH
jgi:hypothetical protein